MAAPLLRHSQDSCLTFLRSSTYYSNKRFLSILRKCFANEQVSRKRKVDPVASTKSGVSRKSIKIPDKITRSPTAILEALAKTVRSDVNKPMYQNIDDPALLSYSDGLMRHHLAALASGKNAAQAMIAMNPEYYTNFWEEPLPESFDTVLTGYKYEDPSEDALLERIGRRKVKESIQIYNSIKSQDGKISVPTLELFLDLLSVFNHEDPDGKDVIAHYIDPEFPRDSPFPASTWKEGCLAEEVFRSLPEKTPKAYCSLITGMAQNNDKEKAFQLYREAKEAGIKVDVFTYNSLLAIASLELQTMDEIIEEIETLMKDMAAADVDPNVETFNSALKNSTRISRWRGSKQYAISILSEMNACGFEPTLGTWHHILSIFYYHKDKSAKKPDMFKKMLSMMKGKAFDAHQPNDVYFFRTAMKVIYTHIPDSQLALDLHDILTSHNNFVCMGHRQLKFAYFKELFLLLAPVEHTDVVMDIYESTVPYIFMPTKEVFQAIFDNIETHDTYHYLPRIYEDIDSSNYFMENGAIPLFHLMALKKHDPKLQQQLCDLTSAFVYRWTESQANRMSPYLDGQVIGNMILIYLNGDKVDEAMSVLELFINKRKLHATDPSDQSLQALGEALISSNDYESTKTVITLMCSLESENIPLLVSKALNTFELSDKERFVNC